ncbi:YraN family protein [Desulfurispora thermophila]|uniref:YraN family protein n=1 Tax=Desulfurispora thermophila TaxID=265470 RepID=UPI0004764D54|nr:YraN family protein [Desulfurispora thermophila]
MTRERLVAGKIGEQAAAQYLAARGYKILHRNYRCRLGEVDILAIDGNYLVLVEVKTRHGNQYGLPQESVHCFKQEKLRRIATYLTSLPHYRHCQLRFDVVAVWLSPDNKPAKLQHIVNAFW